MKRIILTIAAVLLASFSYAQTSDAILSLIEKANHSTRSVQFKEKRTSVGEGAKTVTVEGELLYKEAENYLSMLYTNKDVFIIDGNKMTIVRDGNANIFDLTKNVMMKGLSTVLMSSFSGKPGVFAAEQKADINAVKEGGDYVVTVKATKKAPRGYSRIIIRYRTSDCAISGMQMDEFTGATTSYFMK